MDTAIDIGGLAPYEKLISALAKSEGSAALDLRIARMIFPDRSVVEIDGEPVFWDGGGSANWEPVPRYSRSVDAAFGWERIIRVEKMSEGKRIFWRARQYPLLDGDGATEATARRVAALADWITNKLAGPDPNFPETALPAGVMKPVVFPKGYGYRRPSLDRIGRFTMQPFQEQSDPQLVIEILLGHIRDLRKELANKAEDTIEMQPASDPSRGTLGFRKNAIKRLRAVEQSTAKFTGVSNLLLSEVTKTWLFENRPRVKNKERMLRSVRRLIEFHGDRPIDGYSKGDIREFCNALWDAPKYVPDELKRLPLPSMLEYYRDRPEVQRITVRTVSNYHKDLVAIFNWAHARDMCSGNPAFGLIFVDRRLQSEKRRYFDEDDLRKIFMESPIYAGCEASNNRIVSGEYIFRDSLYWLALVGLFSGARLNEITKSVVDDYRQEGGIHFLDLHQRRSEPHLKSRSADRQVPLHPMLIRLGFLDWVHSRREKGMERVFQEMFGRKDNVVSHWSASWMRYQRRIGMTDPRKVFHSFRHTFKRACREAGIHEEIHDALTGHNPFFSGRVYGGPVPLHIKYEAIQKVRYPNLDLSHLYDPEKLAQKKVIDEWANWRVRRKADAFARRRDWEATASGKTLSH